MKKYLPLLSVLAIAKCFIQVMGNRNYGFHRDELLHLAVSEHLDFGYFEFPPLIAVLGKVAHALFGYTLWGTRLFPTLAGVGILLLCCLIAIEMGGNYKAVLLSGVSILTFFPFYRNHTLFQPVAFDQLCWTLGFYLLVRFFKTQHPKFLILLGLTAGIGLMNKYTIVVWGFGIAVGLLFHKKGALYKTKWLYIAGLIALVIFFPNVVWQAQHDFPFLLHLQLLREKQLDNLGPLEFGLVQLYFPITLSISIFGIVAFFRDTALKKYKSIGVAALVTFVTLWALQSKAYYVFAIYPVLFAGGAVAIEQRVTNAPRLYFALILLMVIPTLFIIPTLTPVLPIDVYTKYYHKTEKDGRVELTSDYADMFGWEEQVKIVDSLYRTLSDAEQKSCVLWAENYGEAGALTILGDRYGLPDPICRHGSFWLWGYGNKDASVWISLGNEKESVSSVFEEVIPIKIIRHKYAIEEENNIPLYLCRRPKLNIASWWADYRDHVFD